MKTSMVVAMIDEAESQSKAMVAGLGDEDLQSQVPEGIARLNDQSAFLGEPLPVVRDPQYRAFAADQSIVMFLGRDAEISFVSLSPRLISTDTPTRVEDQVRLGFNVERALTEVARVRLPPEAAVSMSMSLLDQLFSAGLVNGEALRTAIDAMVAKSSMSPDLSDDQ